MSIEAAWNMQLFRTENRRTMAASLTTSRTRAYGMMKHGRRAWDVLQLLQYTRRIEEGPNR